jgi:hypothetical protein
VLAGWREWRAGRKSLEACVRATRDEVLEAALALEHAQLRAMAAAGAGRGADCGGTRTPQAAPARRSEDGNDGRRGVRSRATLHATRLDPRRATLALLAEEPVLLEEAPRMLAFAAQGKRVTTLAIGPDAGRVLELLDGSRTLDELARSNPGLAAAARTLAASGLVDLGLQEAEEVAAPADPAQPRARASLAARGSDR